MQSKPKSRMLVLRICLLVALSIAAVVLIARSPAQADDPVTCIQCDNDHHGRRDNCWDQYNACINDPYHTYTQAQCETIRDQCLDTDSTDYTNCLYGWPSSPFCTVTYPNNPTNPYPCQHRTQCDTTCRDIRADCLQNDGTTCGEDYNNCVVGCCEQ